MKKDYKANKFLILLMGMILSFGVYAEKNEEKTSAESKEEPKHCLLYTSPSPRDLSTSRMPSSA